MDRETRDRVVNRAGNICEFCRLPQAAQPFVTFHVDHIVATQHRQDDSLDNLCLCCQSCNLHKGTILTSIDPQTDEMVRLFNPRTDVWREHFRLVDHEIIGLTEIGRATARLLAMNSPKRIELRRLRDIR